MHDKGEKTVLGVTIPAGGGKDDGEKVLDILARHPSTARFISKKLAQRFVADDPPPTLIDRMAKTFRDTNGDIREVMKTMLTSKEFFSQGAYRAKVKTPFEMIVSAVRATGAQVDFAFPLANQIAQLGEPLYRKLEPTGYSNANAEWVNSASLAGAHEFRAGAGAEQGAGHQGGRAHVQRTIRRRSRGRCCSPMRRRRRSRRSRRRWPIRREESEARVAGAGGGLGARVAGFPERSVQRTV